MAKKNLSLSVKLKAIDKMSAPLKNVAGASGKVIESLKKTETRLKAVDSQSRQFDTFKNLLTQSRNTSRELNTAQVEIKQLAKDIEKSVAPTKKLKNELKVADKQVAALAQEMKEAKNPSAALSHQFQQAKKQAADLGREFRRTERENKSLSRAFDQAKNKANQLKEVQARQTQQLREQRQALKDSGLSSRNFGTAQRNAQRESEALNRQLERQAKKLERISQIEQRVAQSRSRMQRSMQVSANMTIVAHGAQQASSGIKRALSGPIGTAIEFEESMDKVGAVARASNSELAKLTKTARELGATTSFSATEASEGMKYLAMAGFKTNQVIATMPGLLNLSTAGATDLAATSDIASDILSSFGMKPEQMDKVADVLTATFTTANTDLRMLGETMKYVAPIARKAGMSLEETSAMAGLLANVGVKSSQAGTTLKAMVTRLAAPAKRGANALAEMGVETKDSAGNMRSMIDILEELSVATKDIGSGNQIRVAKDIFGVEAAAGMTELLSKASKGGIRKYYNSVADSLKRASKVATKMNDNTRGKIKALSSAYESLQITVGNLLLPMLKELLIWVTEITRKIDDWSNANPNLVQALALSASALGILTVVAVPLFLIMASLNSMSAILSFAFTKIASTARLLAIRTNLVTLVTQGATQATLRFNMALLANPVTFMVAGIMALITVLGLLIYKYFQPLKAFLVGFWSGFKEGIAPVIEALAPLMIVLSPIGDVFSWLWDQLSKVVNWFSQLLQPVNMSAEALQAAGDTGASFGKRVGESITWLIDVIKTLFEWSPLSLIMKAWGAAFDWLEGKFDFVGKAAAKIKGFFGIGKDEQVPSTDNKIADISDAVEKRKHTSELKEPLKVASKLKAVAAAGGIAASSMVLPVAANPVALPQAYQETLANNASLQPKAVAQQTIPQLSATQLPLDTGVMVTINQMDINVNAQPGQSTQDIAKEVRRQFEQRMRDEQVKRRGELYDH